MERDQVKRVIETLLYITDHALTEKEISYVLDTKKFPPKEIQAIIHEIGEEFEQRGSAIRLMEVAGGYQMATTNDMAPWIRRLYKERLTVRLSKSALETLSIIAYKQPISRAEIEQIRGVEATGVMDTLIERRLVKVVGRKETIGRPLLYGTTVDFLRQFGLKHLSELPDLESLEIPEPSENGEANEEKELAAVGNQTSGAYFQPEENNKANPEPAE